MPALRKIKQYGLTEVYISPGRPAQVDVVLVHGLNGHPKDTWTSKSDVFWPTDVLPEFLENSSLRILTYGYNANVTAFTDGASKDRVHHHAETLASELHANRSLRGCLERPIVFVCHSLGGLVVKRCLIMCRSQESDKLRHLRSIYISTFGILFLGTPHTGSDVAKWGLLLQKICSAVFPKKFMDTSPQLIETLKSNNEVLQNINRLFNDFFSRFHVYFFHETKPLDMKGTREFIVDESSAAPDVQGAERMGIEADHSSMVKFEDDTSPGFEAVAEAIIRYSREAPPVITGRWKEERAHVHLQVHSMADELTRSSVDFSQEPPQSEAEARMGSSVPNLPLPPIFSADHTPRMAQSVEILPPQRGPLFVVPPGFHPNATFIGMEKELNELHIRLFNTKRREERAAAVLICGGPGSGKTHLAREYVHSHRQDFPGGIFWIDAKSALSMSTCYWDVAQAAALIDGSKEYPTSTDASIFVEQVRHWFESREEWLIVFDGLNFDEDSQLNAFKKYLPFRKNTSIIYTSVDRTLAKKQRLFEPYRLNVRPLKAEEARQLLFDDLDIENPTPEQYKKATEIVHYYQGLPLAIHAIAHRLTATRKPLERYHLNSHLTDQRLAEPFIGIMHDLRAHEHFEAMNLINLLAFFGHHVPVGMITWGKSALEGAQNLPILTSSRPGEPGDLDTTLGVLIQYGLIERISDRYPGKLLLRHEDPKVDSPESEISGSESFTESMTASGIYQNAIDVVKIHSVVQAFFRDELRIVDGKNKQQIMISGSTDSGSSQLPDNQTSQPITSFYTWWLLNATRVFCRSYEIARYKMIRDRTGCLFVKDLREYETHAERLMFHYRKIDSRPSIAIVKDTKKLLKEAVRDIRMEVGKISPNTSEESLRHGKSIFDRSSSSSSGPSSSLEDSMASHRSTWNEADWESSKVQSPVELADPKQNPFHFPDTSLYREGTQEQNPFQLPLADIYRERLQEQNDGYLSDGEGGLRVKSRRSSADSSRYSENTEIPPPPAAPSGLISSVDGPAPASVAVPTLASVPDSGESGWETVQRKKGSKSSDSPKKRPRFRGRLRDLGSFRPSPITKMSSAQGEGSMSRIPSGSSERNPTPTNAKEMLASFHKPDARKQAEDANQNENQSAWTSPVVSPPATTQPSAENPLSAPSQSAPSVLCQRSQLSPKPRPKSTIENRSDLQSEFTPTTGQTSSAKPSPTLAEFGKHHRLNPMSYSDPSLVGGRGQSHSNPNSAPGSRNHSRHPSSVIPTSFSRESSRASVPNPQTSRLNPTHPAFIPRLSTNELASRYVPVPEGGMIIDVQPRNTRRWDQNPVYAASNISTSPPRQAMPGGYTSEPLSADMSRDPSGQSRGSWQTDPAPATRQISQQLPQPPMAFGPQLPNSPTYTVVYAPENNTNGQAAAYAVPVAAPNPIDYLGLSNRFEYGGEPDTSVNGPPVNQNIFFGEHEVDVDEARRRVMDWNLRQSSALMYDPRTGQPFLTAPRMQAQRSDPGTTIIPVPMAVPMPIPVTTTTQFAGRARSGSSPDPYPGMGLGLGLGLGLGSGVDPRYSSPRSR